MFKSLEKEFNSIKSSKEELKDFSLVIGAVLVLIGFLKSRHELTQDSYMLILIALIVFAAGIFAPHALKPFQRAWMMLAFVLNYIMTRVILFAMFIGVFTPIGFLMKYIVRKSLLGDIDESRGSYWIHRKKVVKKKEDYKSQF